jgi:hypothetical protein
MEIKHRKEQRQREQRKQRNQRAQTEERGCAIERLIDIDSDRWRAKQRG